MELKNKWIQTQACIWNPNFKSRHIFQDFSNPEKFNSNQPLHRSQSQDPRRATTHSPMNPGPPKTHSELLPTTPQTQVHPQHHDPTLMSTMTTQNLRSTTTKTQIVTYTSHSLKPRPKSIMLLLHKSNPKPIDWLRRRQIGDVGGGYGFAGMREIFTLVDRVHAELEVSKGERREEKGENSPDWRRSVGGRQTFDEVWGGATSLYRRCVGVELRWAWGWVSRCVRRAKFAK